MNQQEAAQQMLERIASRVNEDPLFRGTNIYGSQRHVDYSQFVPRGHTHTAKS